MVQTQRSQKASAGEDRGHNYRMQGLKNESSLHRIGSGVHIITTQTCEAGFSFCFSYPGNVRGLL